MILKFQLHFADGYKKARLYSKFYHIKMGINIRFTGKIDFGTEPYLIELGNDITIANGAIFYTHDGGVWVFRKTHPGINIYKKIIIGNNVFIGGHTIILPGVKIGNNVVIGAGSIITKDVESDSVYCGVPAKKVRTIEDYYTKSIQNAIFIDNKLSQEQQIKKHFEL